MARGMLSDKHRDWLVAEMSRWQREGILSDEQADRILQLYETPDEAAQRKHSLALFTLTAVAAFLVVLGAFLLIGYSWEAMAREAKLAIIFGVILSTYGLGFYLRYSRKARLASEIAFFVACIFYGFGAWLIAETLHVQTHYSDGLWIWALGVLPFALCLDTFLLHLLLAGLLATWVGTEILGVGLPVLPRLFGSWIVLPGACYTLPLLALPGLLWAYRRRSPALLVIYVPLAAGWVILQPVAWHAHANPIYIAGAAGAVLLACAQCHPVGSRMAIPYRVYGVLTTGGVLMLLSFVDFCRELLRADAAHAHLVASVVLVLVGAVMILAADRARAREPRVGLPSDSPWAGILRRQWLPLGLLLVMGSLCLWNGLFAAAGSTSGHPGELLDKGNPIVLLPALVANVGMVVLAVWLMRVGLQEDRAVPFVAGVLLFLLWVVQRYCDLFAGVGGMLGASILFFLCGAGLFGVARFWMHRKEIPHV